MYCGQVETGLLTLFCQVRAFPPQKALLLSAKKKDHNNTKLWEYVESLCVCIRVYKNLLIHIHDT